MSRQYPYTAWKVQPAGKPVEVNVIGEALYGQGWMKLESGGTIHAGDLFPSKELAIEAGLADCKVQQAAIDKRQSNLDKKRSTLERARTTA